MCYRSEVISLSVSKQIIIIINISWALTSRPTQALSSSLITEDTWRVLDDLDDRKFSGVDIEKEDVQICEIHSMNQRGG